MNKKICFKCGIEKPIEDFYKHPQMSDGHLNKCKECNKIDVQNNYAKRVDYYKEYDKNRQRHSINRILSHRYNGIKARCEQSYASSKQRGGYTVTGMAYLSREEFKQWAKENMDTFMEVYIKWEASDYNSRLMPSVDRIDATKGYTADNMQWLSKGANSSKANTVDDPDRWRKMYRSRWGHDYKE